MGILMLNSENYSSSIGGGVDVIPNPEGTPTATLTTVEINGTIYSLSQGGGGEINKMTSQSSMNVSGEVN